MNHLVMLDPGTRSHPSHPLVAPSRSSASTRLWSRRPASSIKHPPPKRPKATPRWKTQAVGRQTSAPHRSNTRRAPILLDDPENMVPRTSWFLEKGVPLQCMKIAILLGLTPHRSKVLMINIMIRSDHRTATQTYQFDTFLHKFYCN